MTIFKTGCVAAGLATCLVAPSFAQDFERTLEARQSQFQLILFNIQTLGGMARGTVDYDPILAAQAAANLVSVSQLHQMPMWPEGSSSDSLETTRALPAIWKDPDDFIAKWRDFGSQAAALAEVAGNGQAALGPAVGALGQTCNACHEEYRTPDES